MKRHRENITGKKFNRLTAISFSHVDKWGNGNWICRCDCGNETTLPKYKISNGHVKSCGCLKIEEQHKATTTHGQTIGGKPSRTWKSWSCMRSRCKSDEPGKAAVYKNRGITVDPRWESFDEFFKDMGECPPNHTIERKDNYKGYNKENCIWADTETQNNNRRDSVFIEFQGQRLTRSQWGRKLGISQAMIRERMRKGWSAEKALTTPSRWNRSFPHRINRRRAQE